MAPLNVEAVLPLLDRSTDALRPIGVFRMETLRPQPQSWMRFVVAFQVINWTCRALLLTVLAARAPASSGATATAAGSSSNSNSSSSSRLTRFGGCYAVSLLVSAYASVRGAMLLYAMLDMPRSVQYQYDGSVVVAAYDAAGVAMDADARDDDDPTNRLLHHVVATNEVFVGYLLFDSIQLLLNFGKGGYGKLDMALHHAGFLFCALVCQYHMVLLLPFTWLIMGELSTVFLNLRWLLRQLHLSTRVVEVLFASTFFATRIVLYGWGLTHLVRTVYLSPSEEESEEVHGRHHQPGGSGPPVMSPALRGAVVFTLVAFFFLNAFWFRSILRIAVGGGGGKGGGKDRRKQKRS